MRQTDISNIFIILVTPESSENIGSVCRAMKSMSFRKLRIVGKKNNYNEEKVSILSRFGFDLWQNAEFFETVQEAILDCTLVAGTTRRRGEKRKNRLIYPEELASFLENRNEKIGILFGNERTGLTDSEISLCNLAVEIPSDKKFGSLNLSHAVQIICCYLYRAKLALSPSFSPLEQKTLQKSSKEICEILVDSGLFRLGGRENMEQFLTDLLSRAKITEKELRYFKSIFTKIDGIKHKSVFFTK